MHFVGSSFNVSLLTVLSCWEEINPFVSPFASWRDPQYNTMTHKMVYIKVSILFSCRKNTAVTLLKSPNLSCVLLYIVHELHILKFLHTRMCGASQWISLIKCCLPHMRLMNKNTSLLSGTQVLPPFPLILITKDSVKPASPVNHSASVTYAMLIKDKKLIFKGWIQI